MIAIATRSSEVWSNTRSSVYVDPEKKPWVAGNDLIVDGATIPRIFWSVTGGPLEGRFRNASIVHDEACVRMAEPWEDVHLMVLQCMPLRRTVGRQDQDPLRGRVPLRTALDDPNGCRDANGY
jgi:hypothetical protein